MKRTMLMAAVACLLAMAMNVNQASAGTVSVTGAYYGGTNVLVVAPTLVGGSAASIADRTAGETVYQGNMRRQGSEVLIAAVAGVTSPSLSTNVVYFTNGTVVVTNTTIRPVRVAVPTSGLSAADGTVYWMKVNGPRKGLVLTVRTGTIADGGCLTLSDGGGGAIPVYDNTRIEASAFPGFQGGLYATKSTTNACSVSCSEWQ